MRRSSAVMLAQPKQRRRQERPPREINFSFLVLNPQIGNGFVSKAGHGVCERARAINKQTTRRPRSRLGARAYIGARKGGLRRVPQRQKKCEGQKHQKAQSRSTTKHTHTRKHTHTHTHTAPPQRAPSTRTPPDPHRPSGPESRKPPRAAAEDDRREIRGTN